MLLCGEIIDLQLGVALGLSTLAAAGLGNLVSCASGVVTGGFIERFVYRFKWPPTARLSPQQAETSAARNAHLVGSVAVAWPLRVVVSSVLFCLLWRQKDAGLEQMLELIVFRPCLPVPYREVDAACLSPQRRKKRCRSDEEGKTAG
ncbi:hypothetical protein cyc_00232 [Cyclospora cayetanensis]|uniref:Uncharacterized protein n=1 Tax=Cyclospora cayetanensis TaxID=88456 RepID=A0A1D3D3J0_9EIME|nr:hypothetical protein cyc_00232 [Cyclospora cayetanensis]